MSVIELERPQPCVPCERTCLDVVLEAFPGATVATPEDRELLELVRQEAEVEQWNRGVRELAEEGHPAL